jgi:hypothetical protein
VRGGSSLYQYKYMKSNRDLVRTHTELLEALVPAVQATVGTKFSDAQIVDELRLANYDPDRTVVSLLEKAKTASASTRTDCSNGWRRGHFSG